MKIEMNMKNFLIFVVNMIQRTISIELARQRLGKKAERLTDKQVQSIIDMLYSLCDRIVSSVVQRPSVVDSK